MATTEKSREIRCECGQLLFRIAGDGPVTIEVRCKRCKVMNHQHFGLGKKEAKTAFNP